MIARRPIGRYDNVLVGPSQDAEVLTTHVPRMIPMIRSSPGGKGWELVYPAGLFGHVTADGRTRSLLECASDATARADGDLAVFPLPAGAIGGIELGPLRVRFREMEEDDVAVVEPATSDETEPTAIGIGVVAMSLVLVAILGLPRTSRIDPGRVEIAVASPPPTSSSTGAARSPFPEITPEATAVATLANGQTPGATPTGTPAANPSGSATAIARATMTPASSATPHTTSVARASPQATPRERDPLALAVGSPRDVRTKPTPTPARTPPPSGFLADKPELDDELFAEQLDAVPVMTPSKSSFALTGGDGALGGSFSSGATAAVGGAIRDGGKGVVGPVDVGPAGTGGVKVASAGKVETPVEGRVLSAALQVTGTIDTDGVAAVMQEASSGFRQCYESALRRNTRLSGKVVLTWRIVEDGGVEEIATGTSTLRDEQIERCLMTRVRVLRFPRPDGGTVNVEFPMVFRAAAEL